MLNEDDMIRRDHCEYLNVLSENLYRNEIGRNLQLFYFPNKYFILLMSSL